MALGVQPADGRLFLDVRPFGHNTQLVIVEIAVRKIDTVGVRTEMLVQKEEIALEYGVRGDIKQAPPIANAFLKRDVELVADKRSLFTRAAQETDVAQLLRVTDDQRTFTTKKGDGSGCQIALRGFVEDHEIEEARFGGQDLFQRAVGTGPRRKRPEGNVQVDLFTQLLF